MKILLLVLLSVLASGQTSKPKPKPKPKPTVEAGYGAQGYGLKATVNFKRLATTAVPSVGLSCIPNTTGGTATGFNFLRSTTSGGPYTILGTSPMASTCAYTDNAVALGTTYYYVANAMNGAGTSANSNQVVASIPTPPTISGVNPSSGSTLGGTPVTITGTNFAAGATVTFDTGLTATNVVVVSSTTITATTPADTTSGAVTVTVTNANGLSVSLTNAYTYILPPNPPTNLTVGTVTATNVPLQWKAPKPQANYTTVAYEVDRGATVPATLIGIVNTTNFSDKKPCPATCYYAVKAYDINDYLGTAFAISLPSNVVKVVE